MSESIYISLSAGQKESLTLEFDQPLEKDGEYGKQYTYGCVPIITGETRYTANPRVHGEIQKLGVGKGDTIIIEKVKATPHDYITVGLPDNLPRKLETNFDKPTDKEVMDKYATGEIVDKGVASFEKQFKEPDQKMDLHELSLRVESLEKDNVAIKKEVVTLRQEVDELKKNALPF